jgi:FKBP-type peptidyl-prolyl cis-trans isomerase (trigger factor)
MQVAVQKLPKNTFKLTVTLTVEEVQAAQDKVWDTIIKNAELDGFRKGHAPAELVKQKVDPRKLETELITDLIKTYYPQAVEEHKLLPILDPKLDLTDFTAGQPFTFAATIATRPEITVGDYKKAVADAYQAKQAAAPAATTDTATKAAVQLTPTEVIDAITSVTTADISDLLIEAEVSKMLSRLVNQLQTIKLDMDAYLKAQNKTAEGIKAEYANIAHRNITGELGLVEVVKQEGVEVTDSEVAQTLAAMGDPKLQEQYSKDDYQKAYIRAIIAKNKVIWKLGSPDSGTKEVQ